MLIIVLYQPMAIETPRTPESTGLEDSLTLRESYRRSLDDLDVIGYNASIDGVEVGEFHLVYSAARKEVELDWIYAYDKREGYATEMVKRILTLPLPDGSSFAESGYEIIASIDSMSEDGYQLLQSFIDHGDVRRDDNDFYHYLPR